MAAVSYFRAKQRRRFDGFKSHLTSVWREAIHSQTEWRACHSLLITRFHSSIPAVVVRRRCSTLSKWALRGLNDTPQGESQTSPCNWAARLKPYPSHDPSDADCGLMSLKTG